MNTLDEDIWNSEIQIGSWELKNFNKAWCISDLSLSYPERKRNQGTSVSEFLYCFDVGQDNFVIFFLHLALRNHKERNMFT